MLMDLKAGSFLLGQINRSHAVGYFFRTWRATRVGEVENSKELKPRPSEIANDLSVRPVNFFDSLTAPFPNAPGPTDEYGYLYPAFTPASVKPPALHRKELFRIRGSNPIPDKCIGPNILVQLSLVQIEIEIPARSQCTRDGAKRSHKIASARQMINNPPFRCNQVNLYRQTECAYVSSTNPNVQFLSAGLFARDSTHLRGEVGSENSQAAACKFDCCHAGTASDFAYLPGLRQDWRQHSSARRGPRQPRRFPPIKSVVELADCPIGW
jgi:hypothetical protein